MKKGILFALCFALSGFFLFLVFGCGTGGSSGGGGGTSFTANIYVSVTGSDTTGNGSLSKPFKTIQKGLNEAKTKEVVGVLAGVYGEHVSWPGTYEGITLRGVSNTTAILSGEGSGICLTIDQLTLDQMITVESMMITDGNSAGSGGGINFSEDNTVTLHLKDLNVYKNVCSSYGGGLYIKYDSDNVVVELCTFSSNEAGITGGGIDQPDGNLIVVDSTFTYNAGGQAGGGINSSGTGQTVIEDSTFSNNNVDFYGGGVNFDNSGASLLKIVGCTFENNVTYIRGGAIDSKAPMIVEKTILKNNKAWQPGGAIGIWQNGGADIINSVFIGNTAVESGGAIVYQKGNGTSLSIMNCTFVTNECGAAPTYNGSAVYIMNAGTGTTDIINSIFWNNEYGSGVVEVTSEGSATYDISYCDFASGHIGGNYTEVSNVNDAPIFASYPTNLQIEGPATVTGGGTKEGAPIDDIDDYPRTDPDHVSIGAYEVR